MASAKKHREWAKQNEDLALNLIASLPAATDWALTVLFYAMVHEVDAFFADRGERIPRGHPAMMSALYAVKEWETLGQLYELFQGQSTKCRYHCYMPQPHEVKLARTQLALVRAEIKRLDELELGIGPNM